MLQMKKPKMHMYWLKRCAISTPIFASTMPRDKFRNISSFLHFTYNEEENNSNAVGTVRKNRKNIPKMFSSMKLKKGEVKTSSSHGLLALNGEIKKTFTYLARNI